MKRTPLPASTASAAASIWSGVGEVNTCPGQAASSIPCPTKPMWSGSWPEPPPETSATLSAAVIRRRTKRRSGSSATTRAWAAANPSRASARTRSGELMSFFMGSSAPSGPTWATSGLREPGEPARHLDDRLVEEAIALGVAQVRHRQGQFPAAARLLAEQAERVSPRVRGQEVALLALREVADLEDRVEVLRRDGHRVGRARDLRDEGAVLAERERQPVARAGRAVVDDALEHALVSRHRGQPVGRLLHRSHEAAPWASRRSVPAMASLARPTSAGATDRVRSPAARRCGMAAGSPPASPHRLASIPRAAATSTTWRMSRSTAGWVGSARSVTAGARARRAGPATYWVGWLEPIGETSAAAKGSDGVAAPGPRHHGRG